MSILPTAPLNCSQQEEWCACDTICQDTNGNCTTAELVRRVSECGADGAAALCSRVLCSGCGCPGCGSGCSLEEACRALYNGVLQCENPSYSWWYLLVLVPVVAGAVGNVLVCLAVARDRRLHNLTNYFLTSLAIADLLVSLFVMPLGAIPGFLGECIRYPAYPKQKYL
ncbi:hypothetical protein J437_LFUL010328 [Ladona fulva]|uniref:G-protein coupled receptors family 1 profile domain-containing protein n=1 Tax=Ladona fulva TaxID=123851 RepID=A0A8K0K443_LADFU|nr:hypothetical protein J437_LFUL010328 [Ladona fulva]